ncbi:MAG: hypothetical protein IKH77_05930 [Clostridia bacterium]|nr:hypothetical protein [Clostridia bacterium]
MAMLSRARVCVIGPESSICRLLTCMLDNCGYLDPEEDRPHYSLLELQEEVRRRSAEDGGEGDTFLYEMICDAPYGDAIPTTCRLSVKPGPAGLQLAVFAYDSEHRFQPHDWLSLHKRLGNIPMVAQRASEDFTLEKGTVLFVGGHVQEDWTAMDECWLWLMEQYGAGLPTEDALEQMERLARVFREEDYDLDIPGLLQGCMDNLEAIAEGVADEAALGERIESARQAHDYGQLFDCLCRLADSALWETEHNARWLACLRALLEKWNDTHPEQE